VSEREGDNSNAFQKAVADSHTTSHRAYIDRLTEDMILKDAQPTERRNSLEVTIYPDETLDSLPNRGLKIIQKRKGYRYSIDAILLAHFCRLRRGDEIIDLGTGNAIIPLLLATQSMAVRILGVEIQAELIDMARRNVMINHMEENIALIHQDARDLPGCLDKASFDVAISNPPYRSVRTGRVNPNSQKALARHEVFGSLEDMARVASFLLPPMGRFYGIYPASRTVDLLVTLRESNLEPKRIQMVHSSEKEDARLVLAEGVKGGRKELRVLEPLFVYDLKGHFTKEMEKIYSRFQAPGHLPPDTNQGPEARKERGKRLK
jgi:tRNA1Val (adenine37-N6)-methyltransferase